MPRQDAENLELTHLNIIDFVYKLDLLRGERLSMAQETILKASYGLPLDKSELEIFYRATGRSEYAPSECSEVTVIAGRQSGKTSIIAALIALYETNRLHGLRPGQRAYVLIVAPVVHQAAIAFGHLKRYILDSPILKAKISKIRNDEIEFLNGIVIACRPCSYSTIRGVPVICAICDEIAFWRHEQTAANPEQEVIDAIRPAMATVYNTKLIKISTPFRKEGILWREFQKREDLPHLVWHLSTEEMNPKVRKSHLEDARRENEQVFRREYLAEFTDSACGWITSETLDPCIIRGQRELPPAVSGTYAAAIDPAFRDCDFGFAIVHQSRDGRVSVVHATRWTGTKSVPVDFESVSEQINGVLRRYGINTLYGDQFCFPLLHQNFVKLGIQYKERTFGVHTRASIFGNLRHLIAYQKIRILDNSDLERQLLSLEEVKCPNGNIDIRPHGSNKDDIAIAVALAASELPGIVLGSVLLLPGESEGDSSSLRIPGSCDVEAICLNFPECLDAARCLGLRDERKLIPVENIRFTFLASSRKGRDDANREIS